VMSMPWLDPPPESPFDAEGWTDNEADPWWEAPEPVVPADVTVPNQDSALAGLAGHWSARERFAEELPREAPFGFAAGGPLDLLGPNPVLASCTADAFEAGLTALSDDDLAGMLSATQRLTSWQAAMELAAVTEMERRRRRSGARPGSSREQDHVTTELAVTLTLTMRSAEHLLDLARGLARLPGVQAALLAGRIDRSRVAVMVEELAALDQIKAAAIAAAFVNIARKMTTSKLRAEIKRMIMELFPHLVRARAKKAREYARVDAWQEDSGNGGLAGRELSHADVIAADKRLSAIAEALKNGGAKGNMDQLRAAVFVALLTGRDPITLLPGLKDHAGASSTGASSAVSSSAAGSGYARLSGSVNLTLPLKTWLGWSDAPGDVTGHGPLHADTCRDLANCVASGHNPLWCLTLTDEHGRAVAHACADVNAGPPSPGQQDQPNQPNQPNQHGPPGLEIGAWLSRLRFDWLERGTCRHCRQTTAYRPGGKLRHLVNVRQRTCSNPICRRPAEHCDLDHSVPYDKGGRTCECNLAPLCRRHHRCKQAPGWHLSQTEPGYLVWTTPSGRTYAAEPDRYPA